MSGYRFPGSLCVTTSPDIDAGTLCLCRTPVSSSVGLGSNDKILRRHLLGNFRLVAREMITDASRIRNYLAGNGFGLGPGLMPTFFGSPSTLDKIVDLARWVAPVAPRNQIAGIVQAEWSRLVQQALFLPLPPPPPYKVLLDVSPATTDAPDPDALQSSVGWQGTWHMTHAGRFESTIQVQLTRGDGPVQAVYQFSVNATTGDVQAMVGAQVQSPTKTLYDGNLSGAVHLAVKANAFIQVIAGITNVGGTAASGSLTLQVQAGGQVSVTLGPVNVTAQIGPTLTFQQGMSPSLDLNPAVQGGLDKLPDGDFPPMHGIKIIQGRF
jgi:hypothetical protein